MRSATSASTERLAARISGSGVPAPPTDGLVQLHLLEPLFRGLDARLEPLDLGRRVASAAACSARTDSSLCCASTICGPRPSQALWSVSSSAAAGQLRVEPLADVVAEGVETVETSFELFDRDDPRADPRHLGVELGDGFVEPRRFLGRILDQFHLAENRVHLRFELGGTRRQHRDPIAERLERDAIAAELVAQLRDLGVRLVELLHVFSHTSRSARL